MSNLLDITGDDIAQLADAELRELIGLLCEADYRSAGLPTRGITWGGHQDARDGGLDVVVRSEISPPTNSFVPRNTTGFQVKKPDMPKSEILKEMHPNGVLREEIRDLIQANGAYIIISSSGSITATALKSRVGAMTEAVANEANHKRLHLEFYDRGRVATWVRSHPSLILWVRNKIGRPLIGWRPYENWANAPSGIEEEYIMDDGLRLQDVTTTGKGLSVESGLLKLRSALFTPGTSTRLAGLSGVGKTRLVQALFDERVGNRALNQSQVFYADVAESLVPDPNALASQLIALKTRAVLVVDNCPPDLHQRLTQNCSRPESSVSLLTVEYDVRDDLPEETDVFRLEPASEEIIEKLLRKRFLHIGEVDARTIAGFSGGNARVAIALANTVERGETLSRFRDEELFKRLFWQRHGPSEGLLASAEVCSLVYSFEGSDAISEKSELKFLASLVSKSGPELYRDVEELKKRDLIQSRSIWRAVLPHAIANRLATRALESIPKDIIVGKFLSSGSERLIRSFTRRLSFLHDSETAVRIVKDWLTQDGWIGKSIHHLNALGIDVLRNIAPVAPEKALETMEHVANGPEGASFTSRENSHYSEFVRLLRHFAYDASLFDRSVTLMCRYALSESKDENSNSTRDVLKSLFYIYLSGTRSPVEARARIIENLLASEKEDHQELGLFLLDAALETWHFSSSFEFDFGARPRDYGYEPKTKEEIDRWFDIFIGIITRLALSSQPIGETARKLLANNFRGLWTNAGMFDSLDESARHIQVQKAWNDGWVAVRKTLRYDPKNFDNEVKERLDRLEKHLRPSDLLELARIFALSDHHRSVDLEDVLDDNEDLSTAWRRAEETTRKLGAQVAQSPDTLKVLLPDLVSTNGTRLNIFGRGLAEGCSDKFEMFNSLRAEFETKPPETRNISVLMGFLSALAETDPEFYNSTLDRLLDDDALGQWFPLFQTTSTIDQRGVERLHEAVALGKAPIHTFQYLAYGRVHESIYDDDLARLLRKILSKEASISVAVEILKMRFHGRNKESPKLSDSLLAVARDVLSIYTFDEERNKQNNHDYDLADIARVSLNGDDSVPTAAQVCEHLAKAIKEGRVYASDYPRLLGSLAQTQPMVFMDVFLGGNTLDNRQRKIMFSHALESRGLPLNQITDRELLAWCEIDPCVRFPVVASAFQPFTESGETGKLEWKPIVYAILERAPDLDAVLKNLADAIRPSSWSGSHADILLSRAVLFQELYEHDNAKISAWAKARHSDLQESIRQERKLEDGYRRERDESFE